MTRFSTLRGNILMLAMVLAVMLSSCRKARFEISFRLPDDVNTSYTLLYHASSSKQSMMMESEVFVNAGKAEAPGITARPTIVYVLAGGRQPLVAFYAERGDKILISGKSSDPLEWEISGNKINEQWTAWRLENIKTLKDNDPQKINAAVAAFVREHPKDKLSAILLATTYRRAADDKGFRKLWQSLDDRLKTEKMLDLLARTDLPTADTGNITNVALRTFGNGCDTLKPGSTPATILLFWTSKDDGRSAGIDTIASLAKAFPDSASRNIVDICLDPDSIRWASEIRQDSLRNVVRAWIPEGMANQWVMQLRPVSTPSYIVADRSRRQVYRGDDPAKASAEFRRLMKKAPKKAEKKASETTDKQQAS